MTALRDLMAQREALDVQIEEAKAKARDDGLSKVRETMVEYGLTLKDLTAAAGGTTKGSKKTGKVAAKYSSPETGETWAGRGKRPTWLTSALSQGKKLDDFLIK